jgi:HSP20 family protein
MTGHWTKRWDPLGDIQREVGRLIESFEPLQSWSWRIPRQFPPVNLYDAGDRYILTADLPGVQPEDLELLITGESLTLRGERKRPEQIPDESYRRQERPFGRWSRTLTLPEQVNSGAATADFAHGVLTITLPKAEESRPRQVNVTVGAG